MACHAVLLGNSSQLHLFFLLCCITASCRYKFFILSSHLVTALHIIQLLMLHMYLHDVQLSHSHTAIVLYSCYMLCGLVQSLCKASPLSFCHCLMRTVVLHSFSAEMQWPVHPSIIKWYLSWQPQQSQFHQNPHQTIKKDYFSNAQTTVWEQTTVSSLPPIM